VTRRVERTEAVAAALAIAVGGVVIGAAAPAVLAQPRGAAAAAPQAARAGGDCRMGEANPFRDQWLATKVSSKLQFNRQLFGEKVNVKVSAGVATLWGGVSTREHVALAGSVASQVEGIGCVNNFLKVGPPEAEPSRGQP
jgi:hypothetical protein